MPRCTVFFRRRRFVSKTLKVLGARSPLEVLPCIMKWTKVAKKWAKARRMRIMIRQRPLNQRSLAATRTTTTISVPCLMIQIWQSTGRRQPKSPRISHRRRRNHPRRVLIRDRTKGRNPKRRRNRRIPMPPNEVSLLSTSLRVQSVAISKQLTQTRPLQNLQSSSGQSSRVSVQARKLNMKSLRQMIRSVTRRRWKATYLLRRILMTNRTTRRPQRSPLQRRRRKIPTHPSVP
mmetsp:Transcript_2416/g.5597  ORF Transcript_2416/g.5597 Transcript_2416/m.5597 type:complete len:233 (-) Transcript_2416:985-1683(-)